MFLGTIEPEIRSMVREHSRDWGTDEFWIGCSGAFTIERFMHGPGVRLHGNDVSIYTCMLGAYLAGRPVEMTVKPESADELAWLEPYLRGDADRIATMMLGTRFLAWVGKPGRYYERMLDGFVRQFPQLHAKTKEKVEAATVRLDSFHPRDVREYLTEVVPADGAVISFPPFDCLAPEHRLLTAELTWVPCGRLEAGDRILTVEEEPSDGRPVRHWRYATITRSEPGVKDCVRVTLGNGDRIVCTTDHPWLAQVGDRVEWVRADQLSSRPLTVVKPLTPWASEGVEPWQTDLADHFIGLHGELPIDRYPLQTGGYRAIRVRSVELLGPHPIQSISTSAGTYIGEGYAMHNTGGYEAMWKPLETHFDWPEPEYEILDDAGVKATLEAIMDREHWMFASNHRHPDWEDQLVGVVQTSARRRPNYVYASGRHTRIVRPAENLAPVLAPRLAAGDRIGDSISLAQLTGPQFNTLRAQYLNPGIRVGTPAAAFAVLSEGRVVGAFAFLPPKFDPACVYLMSDFAVAGSDYPRLSKLVVLAACSAEARHLLQNMLSRRLTGLATTAFTHNPVSMKYRGVLRLTKRSPSNEPAFEHQLQYEGPLGEWTLAEALTRWKDRWE